MATAAVAGDSAILTQGRTRVRKPEERIVASFAANLGNDVKKMR